MDRLTYNIMSILHALEVRGQGVTITDLTEEMWDNSGRGSPKAKSMIESAFTLGYIRIERKGRVRRIFKSIKGMGFYDKHIAQYSGTTSHAQDTQTTQH